MHIVLDKCFRDDRKSGINVGVANLFGGCWGHGALI